MFWFGTEVNDHLWVIVPVQVLQIIGRQDVDIAAAADSGVVDDALRVTALQQALQGLQSVARLLRIWNLESGRRESSKYWRKQRNVRKNTHMKMVTRCMFCA